MHKSKHGFTLVEVVIVLVVAAILLAMTFNLGWDYINFLKFKQDRETFVNLIDKTIVRTRATNYYDGVKYAYLDVHFRDDGLDISYGTGDVGDSDTCGEGISLDSYDFTDTLFIDLAPTTVRIVPFNIECGQGLGLGNNICAGATTGLTLTMDSQISDDTTCYLFDLQVCKFIQIACI